MIIKNCSKSRLEISRPRTGCKYFKHIDTGGRSRIIPPDMFKDFLLFFDRKLVYHLFSGLMYLVLSIVLFFVFARSIKFFNVRLFSILLFAFALYRLGFFVVLLRKKIKMPADRNP